MTDAPNEDDLIFIVDDEIENCELIERALGRRYRTRSFTDPREALAAVTGTDPSGLVVDYRMPGLDGVELVRGVRQKGLKPGIVMTTAFPELDEVVFAAQLKLFYRILPKPWEPTALLAAVNEAVAAALYNRALRSQARGGK